MSYYRKVLMFCIALVSLSLTACSTPITIDAYDVTRFDTRLNGEIFEQGGKAGVIFSAQHNVKSAATMKMYVTFENEKGNKYSYVLKNNTYVEALLPAGSYQLVDYHLYGFHSSQNYSATSRMDDLHKINKITFTIAPGELVYLGHLNTNAVEIKNTSGNFLARMASTGQYKITILAEDRLNKISAKKRANYSRELGGTPFTVRLFDVQPYATAKTDNKQ